jgi:hypothetical protein
MRKLTLLLIPLLGFAGRAAAAGGTCPSGANYVNTADPTGPHVTLASLGITSCYYIANAPLGSNSNNGTSEDTPFQFGPGMQNCNGNCSLSLLVPAVGIIFRGGDTWHFGNSSAANYAGIVSNCSTNQSISGAFCIAGYNNGTAANPVYVGVDPKWFAGGSWMRPIFTADNSNYCGVHNVNGVNCIHTTMSLGGNGNIDEYYVSSCPYPSSNLGANQIFINFADEHYLIFDNFELTGLCHGAPVAELPYVSYPNSISIVFMNLYVHGWTHTQLAAPQNGSCNANIQVCAVTSAFKGGTAGSGPGSSMFFTVVDGEDSDPAAGATGTSVFYNTAYNVFRYQSSTVPALHVFHDNLYEYMFEGGHSNLIESLDLCPVSVAYNNVFRHIDDSGATGSVGLWFGPQSGCATYIFNNVMYAVGNIQYVNIGGTGITTDPGAYVFFNNTFQTTPLQPIMRCGGANPAASSIVDTNNHYIDDQAYILGPCPTLKTTTSLALTNAKATTRGYRSGSTYGYQPTGSNCNRNSRTCTIGNGNGTTARSYCSALSTAAASDPLLSDAATACLSDTRYGVSYNSTAHTVSYPGRTSVTRPTSGAWDIGAYQFTGGLPQAATPTFSPPAPATFSSANASRDNEHYFWRDDLLHDEWDDGNGRNSRNGKREEHQRSDAPKPTTSLSRRAIRRDGFERSK